ncbi:MAG: YitT family protein [Cellulosilyticaceae bacterium]
MTHHKLDLKRILFIVVGTFLLALSINGVLIPNRLLSGGITGIANFLYFLFDWKVSLLIIILNIPLFIIAFFFLKKHFIIFSLFGMLMLSFWLQLTSGFVITTSEPISVIILGGVLTGLGNGIIFRGDGSTGGSDIICKIIYDRFSISMATVGLSINGIIILFSIYFFGIDLSLLTLATMFIGSRVTNFVVDGLNYKRTLFIVTDLEHYDPIAQHIMHDIHRGVTIIPAEGAYTQSSKYILYTTISMREVAKARHIVSLYDKHAFVTVSPTSQVFGQGRGFIHSDSV